MTASRLSSEAGGHKTAGAAGPTRSRRRWLPLALTIVLTILAVGTPFQRWLQFQLFDAYHRLLPRERLSQPALIVEIDERSLAAYGQWPWPRTRLGQIVERIAAGEPAAIGLDIILSEPDRLSPRRLAESAIGLNPSLAADLARLPDNDTHFAEVLRGKPVVLGIAAGDDAPAVPAERPLPAPPIRTFGEPAGLDRVQRFSGALRNLPEFAFAAAGNALLHGHFEAGLYRRMLLLGRVGESLLPGLALELLRIAAGAAPLEVTADEFGIKAVRVAELTIPSQANGTLWLRYGRHDPSIYVSALELLEGRADPALFERKLVLIGLTGIGLLDRQLTPLGEQVPGVEIHAQLIESILDGDWLLRLDWMPLAEGALLAAMALTLLLLLPRCNPAQASALLAVLLAVCAAAGLAAFNAGFLIDVATPAATATVLFVLTVGAMLAEAQRQRRELAQRLQTEREAALRMAGELDAARRVQLGMLPETPGVLAGDRRVDIKAFMESARVVGGDLYDFFLLNGRKLFVMIGDVSGKGLPAAMYMALVKALCKNAMLRRHESLDLAMTELEVELARENPEMLFVSLLALTLDLETGEMTYCNAGHEPPYTLLPGRPAQRLEYKGGPPLCVLEGYAYPLATYQLSPGETLCLITDGITEAGDSSGNLYGRGRLESLLNALAVNDPDKVIELLRKDTAQFSAGVEPADDQTALVLRWNGSGAGLGSLPSG